MTNDVIYQDFFNELKDYLVANGFSTWQAYARKPMTIDNSSLPFFYLSLGVEDNIDVLDINGTHAEDEDNLLEFQFNFGVQNPDKTDTDLQRLADAEKDAIKLFRTQLYNYCKDTSQTYSGYFGRLRMRVERSEFVNGNKFYETIVLYLTGTYKHTMSTGA